MCSHVKTLASSTGEQPQFQLRLPRTQGTRLPFFDRYESRRAADCHLDCPAPAWGQPWCFGHPLAPSKSRSLLFTSTRVQKSTLGCPARSILRDEEQPVTEQ